jgi:hypothetical protein
LSEVMESAAARMANSTNARVRSLSGLASKGAIAVGQIASVAGGAMAAVAIAQAGFETGQMLQGKISGWMHGDSGDPNEIAQRAAKELSLQNTAIEAYHSKKLTQQDYAEITNTLNGPEQRTMLYKMKTMSAADKAKLTEIKDQNEREHPISQDAHPWSRNSGIGMAPLVEARAKENLETFDKWKAQDNFDKRMEHMRWEDSAAGIVSRSNSNIRVIGLRKLDEQKWSGVKDWST